MNVDRDFLEGKLILGIDLGTTNSGVAVWGCERGVEVLADESDQALLPSVVAWDRPRACWVVGEEAAEVRSRHPTDAAWSVKRIIGRRFSDPGVLYGRQHLAYRLVSGGSHEPLRDVCVDFGGENALRLSAPEISAKVLYRLREVAASRLRLPIERLDLAVITVPAYFNVMQRRATILAGELAGLTVVDLLNEPTAAALAYGSAVLDQREKKILVYDLGGGTFDVSLLEASRDDAGYMFFTRVVDGDTCLGGDDIDESTARWLAEQVRLRYGRTVRPDDHATRQRLRFAAERAKIELSDKQRLTVRLPVLDLGDANPFDAQIELDRCQLEACAAGVLRRAREIARRAVEDVAQLKWEQIDEVILVGGQTLMPAVQRDVQELCGKTPRVNDRPQLAVALGAGEYARILSLGRARFHQNSLINVIALPLGIRLDDDAFAPLVPANATVPHASKPFPVTTLEDNQTSIRVEVLQGQPDARHADQCVLLGSIEMEVPPAPARTPKFEVVLDVLSDGTMKVTVTDARRDRSASLDVFENKIVAWRDERFPIADSGENPGHPPP